MKQVYLKPFTSREDLAWAAGIFEGEGWISIQLYTPAIGITMTDRDVLDKFASVVGGGKVYPRGIKSSGTGGITAKKFQWAWRVTSFENVQAILAYLWPWLCVRRRDRIMWNMAPS